MKVLIETTKVNLIYTNITSPIDGRVGLRLVDPGNFVQPSDATGLVVINMINPITVVFAPYRKIIFLKSLNKLNLGKTINR